jgi:hypothetical protein
MQPTTERREFLRADMNVFLNEESRTARMLAKTVDISERGVHYVMPMAGHGRDSDEVTLEFCLPGDEQPVRALGRVVYDRSDRFKQATAIEFTMLDSSDAERIRRYVGARKRAELFEQLRGQHLLQ